MLVMDLFVSVSEQLETKFFVPFSGARNPHSDCFIVDTMLNNNWPGFNASSLSGNDINWFVLPPPNTPAQATAGAPMRVLIGQFTVMDGSGDPCVDLSGSSVNLEVIEM